MGVKRYIMERITNKEWVQNALIDGVADILMLFLGTIVAYYIRVLIIGL